MCPQIWDDLDNSEKIEVLHRDLQETMTIVSAWISEHIAIRKSYGALEKAQDITAELVSEVAKTMGKMEKRISELRP